MPFAQLPQVWASYVSMEQPREAGSYHKSALHLDSLISSLEGPLNCTWSWRLDEYRELSNSSVSSLGPLWCFLMLKFRLYILAKKSQKECVQQHCIRRGRYQLLPPLVTIFTLNLCSTRPCQPFSLFQWKRDILDLYNHSFSHYTGS